tara:strand:+ start:833 stop:1021 length:189 start_codon:yes stop_codon:yes gene_type:complete
MATKKATPGKFKFPTAAKVAINLAIGTVGTFVDDSRLTDAQKSALGDLIAAGQKTLAAFKVT